MKIGVVPFLNARPLIWKLDEKHQIVYLPPSEMSQALQKGQVDASLCPIIDHYCYPEFPIIPVSVIATQGDVRSVRVLSNRSLDMIERLFADSNSKTSVNLTKLILKKFYGIKKLEIRSTPIYSFRPDQMKSWEAVLQIGDIALSSAPFGITVTDLGREWVRLIQKPFVFAVWLAKNADISKQLNQDLYEAKANGLQHIDDIVSNYKGFWRYETPKLKEYLEKNISFDYGDQETQAISIFEQLLREEKIL
jgi:chorismate dehydratase